MTTTRRDIAHAIARAEAEGVPLSQLDRCVELGLDLLRLLDAVDRNVPAWDQSPTWLVPTLEAMLARAWGVGVPGDPEPPSKPHKAA